MLTDLVCAGHYAVNYRQLMEFISLLMLHMQVDAPHALLLSETLALSETHRSRRPTGHTHTRCTAGVLIGIIQCWWLLAPHAGGCAKLELTGHSYHREASQHAAQDHKSRGTQFTCFTGTKVRLVHKYLACLHAAQDDESRGMHFTCFTGTKVQILTQNALRC